MSKGITLDNARLRGRWVCPACGLEGQQNTANPHGSNVGAHMRLIHPGWRPEPAPDEKPRRRR